MTTFADVDNAKVGSGQVDFMYFGNNLVWPDGAIGINGMITFPHTVLSIEHDGTNLWVVSSNGDTYVVDDDDGTILYTLDPSTVYPGWAAAPAGNVISSRIVKSSDGTHMFTFDVDGYNYLSGTFQSWLHKINVATRSITPIYSDTIAPSYGGIISAQNDGTDEILFHPISAYGGNYMYIYNNTTESTLGVEITNPQYLFGILGPGAWVNDTFLFRGKYWNTNFGGFEDQNLYIASGFYPEPASVAATKLPSLSINQNGVYSALGYFWQTLQTTWAGSYYNMVLQKIDTTGALVETYTYPVYHQSGTYQMDAKIVEVNGLLACIIEPYPSSGAPTTTQAKICFFDPVNETFTGYIGPFTYNWLVNYWNNKESSFVYNGTDKAYYHIPGNNFIYKIGPFGG